MSLFDILKYGNTDLSSKASLNNLPEALFDLYWIKSVYGQSTKLDKADKLYLLITWDDKYDSSQITHFKRALQEYNNEPI